MEVVVLIPGYESAGGAGTLCIPERIAEAVGDIRTGAIRLRVPLLDDVIQVGASEVLQTASIVVVRTPSALSVHRSDGRPLQARIIREHDGCHPTQIGVFLRPVNRFDGPGRRRPNLVGSRRRPDLSMPGRPHSVAGDDRGLQHR